jgi:uncharacterized ferritin-like protein (DUF455 family)
MQRGREDRLRRLYRLLRSFTDAEKAQKEDARTAAIVEQNRLKAALVELKRAEYRRRFAATEHGRQALLSMVARLEVENAALKANATVRCTTLDAGTFEDCAETAVASEEEKVIMLDAGRGNLGCQ